MLKNIEEWNPQEDYSDYPVGLMYDMDFVTMYLKENGYEPHTLSMKEYVLNVMRWIKFWNSNCYNKILVCREGDIEKFFETHKFGTFEVGGHWGLFDEHATSKCQ